MTVDTAELRKLLEAAPPTADIREWWDGWGSATNRVPLALRARFAALLIRCEAWEAVAPELLEEVEALRARVAELSE